MTSEASRFASSSAYYSTLVQTSEVFLSAHQTERKISRHDLLMYAVVVKLAELLPSPQHSVDFESACADGFADIIVFDANNSAKLIIEIKTKNEPWNAGKVIRQLGRYAAAHVEAKPELWLMHETHLAREEHKLLEWKGIRALEFQEQSKSSLARQNRAIVAAADELFESLSRKCGDGTRCDLSELLRARGYIAEKHSIGAEAIRRLVTSGRIQSNFDPENRGLQRKRYIWLPFREHSPTT